MLEWYWRNELCYMKFRGLFTKAYSFKHPCFLFLTVLLDFFQNVIHASCLLKKSSLNEVNISRWLGALIDNVNGHLVLWCGGVFRAALRDVQLFLPSYMPWTGYYLCSCVCFMQFSIIPLCSGCHLKFLVLSVNGNVTSHSHLLPPIPFLLLIYCE